MIKIVQTLKLNNKYLNPIMENIRKNYICEKQVEKSITGTKKLLKYLRKRDTKENLLFLYLK